MKQAFPYELEFWRLENWGSGKKLEAEEEGEGRPYPTPLFIYSDLYSDTYSYTPKRRESLLCGQIDGLVRTLQLSQKSSPFCKRVLHMMLRNLSNYGVLSLRGSPLSRENHNLGLAIRKNII